MTDEFDRFLAAALAPPERAPDAEFVLRVRASCVLDARMARECRRAARDLAGQAMGLAAIAAGLLCLGRSATIVAFVGTSPAIALAATLAAFAIFSTALAAPWTRAPLAEV